MPEFTYDPAAGEAVETTRGASGLSNEDTSPTIEEVESRQVQQFSQGMNRRAQLEQALAAPTDEDIDSGSYHVGQADVEVKLQEAISKASKANNPAERATWNARAEQYAEALVKHQTGKNSLGVVKDFDRDGLSAREELENSSIDVAAALAHAGESDMSDDSIAAFNTQLQSKNKVEAMNAAKLLDDYRKNPEYFKTEDYLPIPESVENEIVNEFGEEVGHILSTTSLALANGIAKPADVFKMYAGHPGVTKAVKTLLKRGTIVLPI